MSMTVNLYKKVDIHPYLIFRTVKDIAEGVVPGTLALAKGDGSTILLSIEGDEYIEIVPEEDDE